MKKKVLILGLIIAIFASGILVDRLLFPSSDLDDSFNDSSQVKHEHMLSMMLETDSGSGQYSLESRSTWPTKEDGYIFNSTLSKCEKGSKLRWDDENNAVVMVGTTSDKCYVYFDVYVPTIADVCSSGDNLASCVITYATTYNSDITSIYYHDSTLANGANDNSYRYAGTSSTTNNYVCFGSDAETCPNDNLYRIIGVFDGRIRLIKADYATSALLGTDTSDYYGTYSYTTSYYQGDSSNLTNIAEYYWNKANGDASYSATNYYNDWSYSELNKTHLNINYLANIGTTWANMIDKTVWKVGGFVSTDVVPSTIYTNEITSPSTQVTSTYESKVGLMYISDYVFAAAPSAWTTTPYNYEGNGASGNKITEENWMYMGLNEWTMARSSFFYKYAYSVTLAGNVDSDARVRYDVHAVRPVFHLTSKVEVLAGSGEIGNPLKISAGA